jgi:hypothetical protein
MGGLLTTATDLGKYVAFHLSAWPARDDEDAGPVRRASVREMAHLWTPSNLTAQLVNGKLQASETGYGFGLRVTSDCRFEHIVAHGGGLPGFGSYMAWLPDYGVGMFAMATLTYLGPAGPISQAWDAMLKTGGLRKRELPPTAMQTEMRDHILNLWKRWDDAEAEQITAVNFFLDAPSAQRQAEIRALKHEVGECTDAGPVIPENWMRGQFNRRARRARSARSSRWHQPSRLPYSTCRFRSSRRQPYGWAHRLARRRACLARGSHRAFALPTEVRRPRPARTLPTGPRAPCRRGQTATIDTRLTRLRCTGGVARALSPGDGAVARIGCLAVASTENAVARTRA